jgi:hypothetical protein
MPANQDTSVQIALKTQRDFLSRELATVERQITRNEQARARLEERFRILEQSKRQAA